MSNARNSDRIDWQLVGSIALIVLAPIGLMVYGMPKPQIKKISKTQKYISFDLDKPDLSVLMPSALREISALVVNDGGDHALVVNDEVGKIYKVDLTSSDVSVLQTFKDSGDFEAIEKINDTIFVGESNGDIYRIVAADTRKIETRLSHSNDVEGLVYDATRNRLLIACKGKAGKGKSFDKMRAIYSMPIDSLKVDKKPAYLISIKKITEFAKKHLNYGVAPSMAKRFAPSAIAIEPQTGHLFIASSAARMLVVIDSNSQILDIAHLDRTIHLQPEGLDFDADGNLYLSNEGRSHRGVIYQFKRRTRFEM